MESGFKSAKPLDVFLLSLLLYILEMCLKITPLTHRLKLAMEMPYRCQTVTWCTLHCAPKQSDRSTTGMRCTQGAVSHFLLNNTSLKGCQSHLWRDTLGITTRLITKWRAGAKSQENTNADWSPSLSLIYCSYKYICSLQLRVWNRTGASFTTIGESNLICFT